MSNVKILPAARPDSRSGIGISLNDFYAYMPKHNYIYTPTGEIWAGASINSRISPINESGVVLSPTLWLDKNKPVEQMTWAPGRPMIIPNKLISDGGWMDRNNVNCFNLYRPPTIKLGSQEKAGLWIEHVGKIYPDDAQHMINFFAHRLQKPQEKINHALVLGGAQGIGKDTIIEPIKHAVGPWNFAEVSPKQLVGRFNGYLKSVILRVSEARDLGTEMDQSSFYEHMKTYTASPPDTLRVDEKHLREYTVLNCCAVIITTNYKTGGIYLPADDRRHYIAWSDCARDQFPEKYWKEFWRWYEAGGGIGHVAAYLASVDLSEWNAKEPPRKTPAFWAIVNSSLAPEDGPLADAIDKLGAPDALTLHDIVGTTDDQELASFLKERKSSRRIPQRLEAAGYVSVCNPGPKDGLWVIDGKRQAIYGKVIISAHDRMLAAQKRASS